VEIGRNTRALIPGFLLNFGGGWWLAKRQWQDGDDDGDDDDDDDDSGAGRGTYPRIGRSLFLPQRQVCRCVCAPFLL